MPLVATLLDSLTTVTATVTVTLTLAPFRAYQLPVIERACTECDRPL